MGTRLIKTSLALVIFCPMVSWASDAISDRAERYSALYERYGLQVEKRDAIAISECGEIYNATFSERACAACDDGVNSCMPVRAYDVVQIDEESRYHMTEEEYKQFGSAIGSVECQDEKNPDVWYNSTGYLVASNVIKIAAHALYHTVRTPYHTWRLEKAFTPILACEFNLRDWQTGKATTYKFKQVLECPGHTDVVGASVKCDWAIVQLTSSVPKSIKPLELGIATADKLVGMPVIGAGHHLGVILENSEVTPLVKLVDRGKVRAKPKGSPLFNQPHMIPYDADTNKYASGQPLIVKIKGKFIVVASHYGQHDPQNKKKGNWDDFKLFNYAELINQQMIEQIKQFAPAAEKSRFDAVSKYTLPYNQIEN